MVRGLLGVVVVVGFFGSDIWVLGLEIYLVWWFDVCYGILGLL